MNHHILTIVPSDQNDDCGLAFLAPPGMPAVAANRCATLAIEAANDDNGERSDEVIAHLERQHFVFLGNPSLVQPPPSVTGLTVTAPLY